MVKKTTVVIVLIIVAVGLVLGINSIMVDEQETEAKNLVARINNEDLTMEELNLYVGIEQLNKNIAHLAPDFAELLQSSEAGKKLLDEYRNVKLDDFIKEVLVKQEAEKTNLTEEEKNTFFNNYVTNVKEQNEMNDAELLTALEQQGFESLVQFKEYIFKNGGLVAVLREKILSQVTVEETEIEDFYNNNQEYFKNAEGEYISLEEVKDDIKKSLIAEKQQNNWNEFIAQLEKKADIEKLI